MGGECNRCRRECRHRGGPCADRCLTEEGSEGPGSQSRPLFSASRPEEYIKQGTKRAGKGARVREEGGVGGATGLIPSGQGGRHGRA